MFSCPDKKMRKIRDFFRTLLGIRKARSIPPPSDRPPTGSNIARGRLRIYLRYPITEEQWAWFLRMGWRVIDMRHERRRYTTVADKIVIRLLKAGPLHRDIMHARLIAAGDARERRKQAARSKRLLRQAIS